MSEFTPFDKRPEWSDVKPVPQDEGPEPVVPIAYTERFKNTMDYFRAIILKNEISKRALALTAEVIDCNAANYTAWHYRRKCLFELGEDLETELKFLNEIISDNTKNYQVWYHRMALLAKLRKVDQKELEFIANILQEDDKNYHAWQHRQWVVKEFNLWSNELAYVDELLAKDFRNNSAWNHRFYVIQHTKGTLKTSESESPNTTTQASSSSVAEAAQAAGTVGFVDKDNVLLSDEVRIEEVAYAFKFISKSPNNESAWNYAYGVASFNGGSDKAIAELQQQVETILKKVPINSHAHWCLLETLLYQIKRGAEDKQDLLTRAIGTCENLSKYDGIRERYWRFRKTILESGGL